MTNSKLLFLFFIHLFKAQICPIETSTYFQSRSSQSTEPAKPSKLLGQICPDQNSCCDDKFLQNQMNSLSITLNYFNLMEQMIDNFKSAFKNVKRDFSQFMNWSLTFPEYQKCIDDNQNNFEKYYQEVKNIFDQNPKELLKSIKSSILDLNGKFLCAICAPHNNFLTQKVKDELEQNQQIYFIEMTLSKTYQRSYFNVVNNIQRFLSYMVQISNLAKFGACFEPNIRQDNTIFNNFHQQRYFSEQINFVFKKCSQNLDQDNIIFNEQYYSCNQIWQGVKPLDNLAVWFGDMKNIYSGVMQGFRILSLMNIDQKIDYSIEFQTNSVNVAAHTNFDFVFRPFNYETKVEEYLQFGQEGLDLNKKFKVGKIEFNLRDIIGKKTFFDYIFIQ